jgi:uncharacterized protein DUF5990
MKAEQAHVTICLHGIDFPGRDFDGKADIKVGPQKGDEVVDDVFGDVKQADFTFELRVERNPKTGKPNFLGPYAHGKPGERFLYLSWGVRQGPLFQMFRRAKISLSHLDWATVETAARTKRPIEATLRLTDKKGGPLCASVKREAIEWRR